MSIVEPLPTGLQYGKGDWVDYVNYWREQDIEWLQARTVLRYANDGARDADLGSPGAGQVVYSDAVDALQLRSNNGTWKKYYGLPQNISVATDTASSVLLSHSLAASKGIALKPASVDFNHPINVLSGVLEGTLTGVKIKVGTATALLATNTTHLTVDKPISTSALLLTGTGTVISAPGKTVAAGTVTADSATVTNLGVTGTLTGGVLNGTGGTIGGVALASNTAVASGGFVASAGYHHGDSGAALVQYRNPGSGALGSSNVRVDNGNIGLNATDIYMSGTARFMGGRAVPWHNAAGTHVAYLGPVIYSGGDPGAANFPDGTIWFS